MYRWSHTWFNPGTPMLYSHDAGDKDLGVAKRCAATSTRQDDGISESLKHELYQKFFRKKKTTSPPKIWTPVCRNIVLEVCMVAANAMWHAVFQHLLQHLLDLQSEVCPRQTQVWSMQVFGFIGVLHVLLCVRVVFLCLKDDGRGGEIIALLAWA